MPHHLLVAISAHGFGHLAQVAPVINACQRLTDQGLAPSFELTFRSKLPKHQIAARVHRPFQLDPGADDFGMVMHDALRVDLAQSLQRYIALHREWDTHVERLAHHLAQLQPTGVLADAPYLTLAAAKAANIPSVAICSLNWADILERCINQDPRAAEQAGASPAQLTQILDQMREAYRCADVVIRPAPAMDAAGFETFATEPLSGDSVQAQRPELMAWVRQQARDYLGHHEDCWIVLASMGGIDLPLHPESWPTECLGRKVVYLMDRQMAMHSRHAIGFDLDRFDFGVMMASCDLVLTKPGYGMFVETRVSRKPMIYIERDDWPESECLMQWADDHLLARKVSLPQIAAGDFADALADLLVQPIVGPANFCGAQVAADIVNQRLLSQPSGR